jgi:ferredoxin
MKLVVDHSKCQGHAMCYASAPNVFVLDDDGYNRMNPVIVDPADLPDVERAVEMCPEGALSLVENGEGTS